MAKGIVGNWSIETSPVKRFQWLRDECAAQIETVVAKEDGMGLSSNGRWKPLRKRGRREFLFSCVADAFLWWLRDECAKRKYKSSLPKTTSTRMIERSVEAYDEEGRREYLFRVGVGCIL
ncbi:hypothetical protein CEXT_320691 [Caerostris extrusa]|uniref:Uncharacterized protein n=1 Tax=Caerostris extrusa TaxID=172846 RepID=A0AAV4V3U4_CAEEX|nr:hypothetical protein CEXT_320691 [Caerostris extrusa]